MRKLDYIVFMLFTIVIILGAIRALLTQDVTINSPKAQDLRNEIDRLETQNDELRMQILNETSYKTIDEKAQAQGFMYLPDHTIYFDP